MGKQKILKNVNLTCTIDGLCAVTTMSYIFVNPYEDDIEALYRIPIPSHAVFQSLAIEVEGKTYNAEVYTPNEASKGYEEAIENGDTPVMLEKQEPGIYHLQAGRIKAGEEVLITLVLAEILLPTKEHCRYFLPTVPNRLNFRTSYQSLKEIDNDRGNPKLGAPSFKWQKTFHIEAKSLYC